MSKMLSWTYVPSKGQLGTIARDEAAENEDIHNTFSEDYPIQSIALEGLS